MKTPKEYRDNLKKCIITKQMLSDCLYSVNKRATNWRDMEREYRHNRHDYYDNEEKAREKKQYYYSLKDTMLTVVQPVCIHRETIIRSERERIYEWDEDSQEYDEDYWKYKKNKEFIHEGSYWNNELKDYVSFGDIIVECDPIYRYYLFYDLDNDHTFHTPIGEEDALNAKLDIIDIDGVYTLAHNNTDDLISTQFIKKIIELIQSNNYQYVA